MQRIASFAALFIATLLPVASPQSPAPQPENVWYWSGDCAEPKVIGIQVLLEGKSVFQSSIRACRMSRTDANAEREQKAKRSFHFSGGHTFQGRYHTKNTETIEGSLWQAGADPHAILLGVNFLAHNQVLLNTIHIVRPEKSTESTLDPGLVIKAYPEK